MPTHSETRTLPYTAQQMYDLVADVGSYPEFLPWCAAARIRSTKEEGAATVMLADLVISFRVFRERFGSRVTLYGVTCTAPRADVVACRTGSRALIFTPGWHKFFFPSGDIAHSPNPAPRYLPPRLQYWNQLPASPLPPR